MSNYIEFFILCVSPEQEKIISFQFLSILDDVVVRELAAHRANQGLLYRASDGKNASYAMIGSSNVLKPLEAVVLVKRGVNIPTIQELQAEYILPLHDISKKYKYMNWMSTSRSISYGNSFFSGFFNDRTACTYYIVELYNNPIYLLSINKFLYAQGILDQLFFVSPLNINNSMFSKGELFHSRTISYYYKGTPDKELDYIAGLLTDKPLVFKGYFIREGNVLKNVYDLSKLIDNNAYIITVDYRNGKQNDAQKQQLIEDQHTLTDLLHLMLLLNENLSKETFNSPGALLRQFFSDLANLSSHLM